MKISNFCLKSLVFVLITNFTKAEDLSVPILDFTTNGATCIPIYSSGEKSSLYFSIDDITFEDKVVSENIKIPFAVFRYSDIAFYDNFPIFDEYSANYSKLIEEKAKLYNGLVDFNTNKFITEKNDKHFDEIDDPNMYTSYLVHDVKDTIKSKYEFKVKKSGIYCLYIAPPLDKGIKNLSIPVYRNNSHGYLSIEEYISYWYMKLSLILGVILLLYLVDSAKIKAHDKFSVSNKISSVPRDLIIYNLVPLIFVQSINVIILYFKNKISPSDSNNMVLIYLETFRDFVIPYIDIIIYYYFWLLFSMGFGITYSIRKCQGSTRQLSPSLIRRANKLLICHIIITIISNQSQIFETLRGIFPLLWIFHSISYYSSTKKAIAKFPAFEEIGVSKKVINKYRISLLSVYLLPIFSWVFKIVVIIILHDGMNFHYMRLTPMKWRMENEKSKSIAFVRFGEEYLIRSVKFENIYLSEYVTIIFIFFIWIKDKGLVTKSKSLVENDKDLLTKSKPSVENKEY